MKILGIDSSGLVASVALLSDDQILAEYTVNYKKTHSQTLLPMIDEIVRMLDFDLKELDAIAIAAGPGSFTGLRIGSATAKGLGLALNKPIISVPTCEGMAYQLFGTNRLIVPILDARRSQVYNGIYEMDGVNLKVVAKQRTITIEELIKELNELNREVIFLGDGVEVHKNIIKELLNVSYEFAPPNLSKQHAGAVAVLGSIYAKQGKVQTAMEHEPIYLRVSQAERELAMKQGKIDEQNL